ncbi:hypothetical protein JCM12296A_14630 [Desulfosarcina cetonica]
MATIMDDMPLKDRVMGPPAAGKPKSTGLLGTSTAGVEAADTDLPAWPSVPFPCPKVRQRHADFGSLVQPVVSVPGCH